MRALAWIPLTAAVVLTGCDGGGDYLDARLPWWQQAQLAEVVGRASQELPANRATLSLSFEVRGEDRETVKAALRAHQEQADAVLKPFQNSVTVRPRLDVFLDDGPLPGKAGDYGRGQTPVYRDDATAEAAATEAADTAPAKTAEMLIRMVHGSASRTAPEQFLGWLDLDLTVTQVERLPELVEALAPLETTEVSPVRWFAAEDAVQQRNLLELAARDAALRARAIAKANSRDVGELVFLRQGPGPCLGEPTLDGLSEDPFAGFGGLLPEKTLVEDAAPVTDLLAGTDLRQPATTRHDAVVCAVYRIR